MGAVTEEWRSLHSVELYSLFSSPNIIGPLKSRKMRWTRRVVRVRESKVAYSVFVVELEGKRALGRPRRKWEDNIKVNL
jgi:hypothetical protein